MTDEQRNWSPRMLRAAFWVGHVLGAEGEVVEVARRSWVQLPLGGAVDFVDLRLAELALRRIGLVRDEDGVLRPVPALAACTADASRSEDDIEPLLAIILDSESPLWLRTSAPDGSTFRPELLPVGAAEALASVIPDPHRREAFLLSRGSKVEVAERESLGEEGEEAVFAACQEELVAAEAPEVARRVRRVSLVSDELGFDIRAPRLDGSIRRIEVKATRSGGDSFRIFVTRNEVTTGRADPDWFLVVVRCPTAGEPGVVGHIDAAGLDPLLPRDRDAAGRWQSAAIRLSAADLVNGLPPA